jgi:hypothetical protein
MTWLWLNVPLMLLFWLAWTLVPLWLVIRHPDTRPGAGVHGEHAPRRPVASTADPAPAPGPVPSASPADVAGGPRQKALAGHH